MRFAGAQIPVTRDLDQNVETIKLALIGPQKINVTI